MMKERTVVFFMFVFGLSKKVPSITTSKSTSTIFWQINNVNLPRGGGFAGHKSAILKINMLRNDVMCRESDW